MQDSVKKVKMKEVFKNCPSCDYRDGFHSMFRKDGELVKWLLICPNCHSVFDIGLTV